MIYVQYNPKNDKITVTSWCHGQRDVLLCSSDLAEVQSLMQLLEEDGEDIQELRPKEKH